VSDDGPQSNAEAVALVAELIEGVARQLTEDYGGPPGYVDLAIGNLHQLADQTNRLAGRMADELEGKPPRRVHKQGGEGELGTRLTGPPHAFIESTDYRCVICGNSKSHPAHND